MARKRFLGRSTKKTTRKPITAEKNIFSIQRTRQMKIKISIAKTCY